MPPIRIRTVEPLQPFTLRVVFTNDECRDIDLTSYIERGLISAPIREDPAYFRSVRVDGGTVSWPNGADIDPDVLYLGLPPNASQAEWEAARERVAHTPLDVSAPPLITSANRRTWSGAAEMPHASVGRPSLVGDPYRIEREAGRQHGRARRRQVRAAEQCAAEEAPADNAPIDSGRRAGHLSLITARNEKL